MNKEKIMREAERFLKRTKSYKFNRDMGEMDNYELDFVISKDGNSQPETVIAYAMNYDSIISFCPFGKEEKEQVEPEWWFNYDTVLFKSLEDGYGIVGMSLTCHYNVWVMIEEWHNGEITHQQGLQKYLQYCKRNGITKERLQEMVLYEGMDVMTLYNPKSISKSVGKMQRETER